MSQSGMSGSSPHAAESASFAAAGGPGEADAVRMGTGCSRRWVGAGGYFAIIEVGR